MNGKQMLDWLSMSTYYRNNHASVNGFATPLRNDKL
jgi:hypothetical protein